MWQNILVGIIVLGAVFYVAKSLIMPWFNKNDSGCAHCEITKARTKQAQNPKPNRRSGTPVKIRLNSRGISPTQSSR